MQARRATIGARGLEHNCLVGGKGQEFSSGVKVKMMAKWVFHSLGINLVGQASPKERELFHATTLTDTHGVYDHMDLRRAINASGRQAPKGYKVINFECYRQVGFPPL